MRVALMCRGLACLVTTLFLACDESAEPGGDSATPPDVAVDVGTASDGDVEPTDATLDASPDPGTDGPPDADQPDADLPDADLPDADLPDADLPDEGSLPPDASAPEDPFSPGPLEVERTSVELQVDDEGGGAFGNEPRVLSADVWIPAGEASGPLLVFAPGFQLGREHYASLGALAGSHGIVVVVPTFGDSLLAPIDHADLAVYLRRFVDWALEAPDIEGRLDRDALVMAGHSRGGKAALLAAIQDERVDGVFVFDPVDLTGNPFAPPQPTPENPSVTPELMPTLNVPTGIIGAGRGAEGAVACAPEGENYQAYFDAAEHSPTILWELPHAGHLDFAEAVPLLLAAGCPAGDDPLSARTFANGTLVAFVRGVVVGDERFLPFVDGRVHPDGVLRAER